MRLLNIHGQHDGQQLLDEEQHIVYLDNYGRMDDLKGAYQAAYHKLAELRRKIQSLQMDEAEKARRMDTLRYQINELERAELKVGEEEALNARRNFLRNSEKFISAVSEADYCMNGDDNSDGALNLLRQAQQALSGIKNLDGDYMELFTRLESVYSEVYDLADILRDKCESFEFSSDELDEVEGRLDQLYRLKKKYGPSVEDMLAYLERCRIELSQITEARKLLPKYSMMQDRQPACALARSFGRSFASLPCQRSSSSAFWKMPPWGRLAATRFGF